METLHSHRHDYVLKDPIIRANEKRVLMVVILTFITMTVEITYGYLSGSMALLADGWHMGSHFGALSITLLVYRLARSRRISEHFSFGTGKLVPLGGFTSAICLGIMALWLFVESIQRMLNPIEIRFTTAIIVAIVGLVVNIVSAWILMPAHSHHESDRSIAEDNGSNHVHDHNHESAFVHVLTDALTSVLAILGLLSGKYWGWDWADPFVGILGSIVISKWAIGLCMQTGWELLDGTSKQIPADQVKQLIEDEHTKVADLHLWRIAPNAIACELTICCNRPLGSEHYRQSLLHHLQIQHLVIEEKACDLAHFST